MQAQAAFGRELGRGIVRQQEGLAYRHKRSLFFLCLIFYLIKSLRREPLLNDDANQSFYVAQHIVEQRPAIANIDNIMNSEGHACKALLLLAIFVGNIGLALWPTNYSNRYRLDLPHH